MCADPGTPGLVRRLPRFPKTLLLEDFNAAGGRFTVVNGNIPPSPWLFDVIS